MLALSVRSWPEPGSLRPATGPRPLLFSCLHQRMLDNLRISTLFPQAGINSLIRARRADDPSNSASCVQNQLRPIGHAVHDDLIFPLDRPSVRWPQVRDWLRVFQWNAWDRRRCPVAPWSSPFMTKSPTTPRFFACQVDADCWKAFLGQPLTNLVGGPRVQWFRAISCPSTESLVVGHRPPTLRAALPVRSKNRLAEFIAAHFRSSSSAQGANRRFANNKKSICFMFWLRHTRMRLGDDMRLRTYENPPWPRKDYARQPAGRWCFAIPAAMARQALFSVEAFSGFRRRWLIGQCAPGPVRSPNACAGTNWLDNLTYGGQRARIRGRVPPPKVPRVRRCLASSLLSAIWPRWRRADRPSPVPLPAGRSTALDTAR